VGITRTHSLKKLEPWALPTPTRFFVKKRGKKLY